LSLSEGADLLAAVLASLLERGEVAVLVERPLAGPALQEGRCKATWKREFKLPWREADPPKVDSDQ